MAATLVVALATLAPWPALADSLVIHYRFLDQYERVDNATCAFPITVNGSANITDALFFDDAGSLERVLETVNHFVTRSASTCY